MRDADHLFQHTAVGDACVTCWHGGTVRRPTPDVSDLELPWLELPHQEEPALITCLKRCCGGGIAGLKHGAAAAPVPVDARRRQAVIDIGTVGALCARHRG